MSASPDSKISVSVRDVHLTYVTEAGGQEPEPGRPARGGLRGRLGLRSRTRVHALQGVTLQVREGEHVGIVGPNGSGKSTLLRVIAGVEPPDSGAVLASATPVLLGVNAALLPHLTGSQNIQLGLLALGFTPGQARAKQKAVAALAGIGDAIHRPMRSYSSGMGARLTFAIAAAADPTILLIDEALGTGDLAFAERSKRTIDDLRARAGTIFLVSHAAKTIEDMCTRAVWLHEGRVVIDGPADEIANAYRWWAWNMAQDKPDVAADLLERARDGRPVHQ